MARSSNSAALTPVNRTPPLAETWARAGHAGFDAVRHQYALAVRFGLLPRSLRAAGRLEIWLAAAERATLGPLARST